MDIASLSMGLSQNKLLSQVGTAVLSKTLDNSQDMAASEVAMIDSIPTAHDLETSVNPAVGSQIDVYA